MCVGECILLWYVFRKAPALQDAVSSTNPPENWETNASI